MTQFPSEWEFDVETTGPAIASIIIPAAQNGIARVLTHITANFMDFSGGGVYGPLVQIFDGATLLFSWTLLSAGVAGSVDRDSISEDMVKTGTQNTSMTIAFNANKANTRQQLLVRGYDQ